MSTERTLHHLAHHLTDHLAHRSRAGIAALTSAALLVSASAAVESPAAAAPATRADLAVAAARLVTPAVQSGTAVVVTWSVRNSGRRKAPATTTSVEVLVAGRPVRLATTTTRAVAPRRRVDGRTTARLPATVPSGRHRLRVCADAGGGVRESDERDNCRLGGVLTVRPVPPPPPPDQAPQLPVMDPGGAVLDSFAETYAWPEDEEAAVAQMSSLCGVVVPARPLAFDAAFGSLRDTLRREAPEGLRLLAADPAYGDPAALQGLAATGVVEASPGLALAALLRAAELEPSVGTHLVNAAALAVATGSPNEALGLLDRAATLRYRVPAGGIPQQAVAAVVRGQALVATGRVAAARPWFEAARTSSPVLSEATTGLATVAACTGDPDRAASLVSEARQRTLQPGGSGRASTQVSTSTRRPDPYSRLDLSQGRAGNLRVLPRPVRSAQLAGYHDAYLGLWQDMTDETLADGHRAQAAEQRLDAADARASRAEVDRRFSLRMLALEAAHRDADTGASAEVDRLEDQLDEHNGEWGAEFLELYEDAADACLGTDDPDRCTLEEAQARCKPALESSHQAWNGLMSRFQDAAARDYAARSRVMSGVGAHLAEESAHELVLVGIENLERDLFTRLIAAGAAWTATTLQWREYCLDDLPPAELDVDDAEAESGGACPVALRAIAYKLSLGPIEVKANCEKITGEISRQVSPLLHAFGEVGYEYRTGTLTVVAGAKAKGGRAGVEGSFKSAIYVTVDTSDGGSFTDVGMQVGPELVTASGPLEGKVYSDEMDISFVAGLRGGD